MPPQTHHPESSPSAASFATVLAALAGPKTMTTNDWTDALEEDVSVVSYEQALDRHALSRHAIHPSSTHAVARDSVSASPAGSTAETRKLRAVEQAEAVEPARPPGRQAGRKLASVTIRVTEEECRLLQQRAAEAGLTVSAYLRSCTFEAEALRAQVKDAVAAMRKGPASVSVNDAARQASGWWLRLLRHA